MDWVAGVAAIGAALLGPPEQTPLPPAWQAIALRVAGPGRPDCTRYEVDGTAGPCLPHFTLDQSGAVNGWSKDGRIGFTRGAIERLTADEFALLAGHEIAHWYLGHNGSSRQAELAADRLGAQLACRAGYDVASGSSLFRFLHPDRHHPARATRIEAALRSGCQVEPGE